MNGQNAKAAPDFRAGHGPPPRTKVGGLTRLAWLPIPLLAAAIIVGRLAGLRESYPSETLTLVLSFTFYTMASLGTLFLIGRSFLASGTPGLLLLECGVILWGSAGTVGDAVSRGDANVNVTIFNTGIFLAGMCHLAGAILSLRPQRALRVTPLWLGTGAALALGALGLVTWAALSNWLPVFFIPEQGGTLVRYCVLISAIAMFVLSAGLLLAGRRAARPPFTTWYALALLLLAVGLFGVMIQLSLGSVVNWLGRTAQWLGGAYLFLAAIATVRQSHLPLLPPENKARPERYPYGVAMAIVLAATAVRFALSPPLGTGAPFLTFYPAVILAALYGGLRAGLLATVLSALIMDYFWIEPFGQFTLGGLADWVSLLFFFLACVMISFLVEATHRARARAAAADTKALLAADREAAAEILKKSEERYHTLFTGMTEGFAIHELLTDESGKPFDYRFLDVNPAFERLTGLKRRDVEGKTQKEVLPGEDPKWLRMYAQVALTGQPVHFENYAPVLKRHYEIFAYRPAPMQFAVIFMNITERKQAEAQLRLSQRTFSELVERAPFGIYVIDSRFRIAEMNTGSQTGAFRNVRPVIGRDFAEAMRILWPEPVAAEIIAAFRHTLETGEPYYSPRFTNPRRDVETVESYEWELHRMTLPDGQYGVICYYFDSTKLREAEKALRESEERFRRYFELGLIGMTMASPAKGIIEVNDEICKILGYERGELLQKTWAELTHPEDLMADVAEFDRVMAGEIDGYTLEKRFIRKDGKVIDATIAARALRRADGSVDYFVVLLQDITDRKRVEEALREAKEELENRVQKRTEDLAKSQERLQHLSSQLLLAQEKERKRVAVELHDGLLSELAAMKMLFEAKMKLLEQGNLADLSEFKKVSDILAMVMKEARGIMNNLHPSVLDELGLIATINWLTGEYQKSYPHIKVRKRLEVAEEDISESVKVVIYRVLQEALNNFARHGKGDLIELSLTKPNHSFALQIRDNGQGFDMKKAQKGLGLESMRERVEISGGEFQIESTPGQGTTIRAIWTNS